MHLFLCVHRKEWGFRSGSASKESAGNTGDTGDAGLISGSGRSPEVGNGNPLQYSFLEKLTDRGAWQATVHGVQKNQTRNWSTKQQQQVSMSTGIGEKKEYRGVEELSVASACRTETQLEKKGYP